MCDNYFYEIYLSESYVKNRPLNKLNFLKLSRYVYVYGFYVQWEKSDSSSIVLNILCRLYSKYLSTAFLHYHVLISQFDHFQFYVNNWIDVRVASPETSKIAKTSKLIFNIGNWTKFRLYLKLKRSIVYSTYWRKIHNTFNFLIPFLICTRCFNLDSI